MIGKETLVCPKPIRVGELYHAAPDSVRIHKGNLGDQKGVYETAAGADLLEILHLKGGKQGLLTFCTEVESAGHHQVESLTRLLRMLSLKRRNKTWFPGIPTAALDHWTWFSIFISKEGRIPKC